MESKVSYVTCERCSKPLLNWEGKVMVDKNLYGTRIPFLKVLCGGCVKHIDEFENGMQKYHHLVELRNYLIHDEDDFFSELTKKEMEEKAVEKHKYIFSKVKGVSGYQEEWSEKRKNRNYSVDEKIEIDEEDERRIMSIPGYMDYDKFMRILFELYDGIKELPKRDFDFVHDRERLKEYKKELKEKKEKLFTEPIQYFLSVGKNDSFENMDELFTFIQEMFEEVLEHKKEVEEALTWIKLEVITYFFETTGIVLKEEDFGF